MQTGKLRCVHLLYVFHLLSAHGLATLVLAGKWGWAVHGTRFFVQKMVGLKFYSIKENSSQASIFLCQNLAWLIERQSQVAGDSQCHTVIFLTATCMYYSALKDVQAIHRFIANIVCTSLLPYFLCPLVALPWITGLGSERYLHVNFMLYSGMTKQKGRYSILKLSTLCSTH
jgi:hypothetical protein